MWGMLEGVPPWVQWVVAIVALVGGMTVWQHFKLRRRFLRDQDLRLRGHAVSVKLGGPSGPSPWWRVLSAGGWRHLANEEAVAVMRIQAMEDFAPHQREDLIVRFLRTGSYPTEEELEELMGDRMLRVRKDRGGAPWPTTAHD